MIISIDLRGILPISLIRDGDSHLLLRLFSPEGAV